MSEKHVCVTLEDPTQDKVFMVRKDTGQFWDANCSVRGQQTRCYGCHRLKKVQIQGGEVPPQNAARPVQVFGSHLARGKCLMVLTSENISGSGL